MPPFDYNAPAELFLAKRTKSSRENYRRFATAAEAIRYAVEDLRTPRAFGAWLEVGDERFNSNEIQRLYEASVLSAAQAWVTEPPAGARFRNETDGAPPRGNSLEKPPGYPTSKRPVKGDGSV
jgi:hypothetical protein